MHPAQLVLWKVFRSGQSRERRSTSVGAAVELLRPVRLCLWDFTSNLGIRNEPISFVCC